MITRIRTRSELLWYIAEHAPSGACRRAIVEGKVVVLGGFCVIPPNGWKGWIVKVTSIHGKDWLVAVTLHPTKHHYYVRMVEKVPWAWWVGVVASIPLHGIMDGDIPIQAARARRQAQEKNDADTYF